MSDTTTITHKMRESGVFGSGSIPIYLTNYNMETLASKCAVFKCTI
jgi:hypothetical protein